MPEQLRISPSPSSLVPNRRHYPVRIIDRALYDGEQKAPSSYKLQPGVHVPKQLTFGSNFIELAASLKGPTTLGLNRESNNFTNVAEAIAQALLKMDNLYAFELGNEPEFWDQRSPAAGGRPWNPQADAASQILWQEKISQLTLRKPLVQAGVFLSPPRWSISELAPLQANHAQYVKSFGGHAYPQSACGRSSASLVDLMSHSKIVRFVNRFRAEVDAAARLNKPYHLSETNSATCGGDGISVTFGAGLWIIDYVMQSIILGVHRVYFHQGTVNHSRSIQLLGSVQSFARFLWSLFCCISAAWCHPNQLFANAWH